MSDIPLISWGEVKFKTSVFKQKIDDEHSINIAKNEKEIHISYNSVNDEPVTNRFIVSQNHHVYLDAGLPELPMVIKPLVNISILPGQSLRTYIDVPLMLQISYGTAKQKMLLKEYPVQPLSRSWFGDPESGEIAYFLESSMDTGVHPCKEENPCIHCPVTIVNKSSQTLTLDRMIIRVPYLTIFSGKKGFYASRTKISYSGQDQISQIVIQKTPPEVDDKLTVYSQPRKAIDSGLFHKSFYFIKTLYNG